MIGILPNITTHVKKNENVIPTQAKNQTVETEQEMREMNDLADDNFGRCYKHAQAFKWKYVNDVKRKSTEHLELNNTVSEVKMSLYQFHILLGITETKISEL